MLTFSETGTIIYFLLTIFGAVFFAYCADKFGKRKVHMVFWVLSFLILFIPSAFRESGVDHSSYYHHYTLAKSYGYDYFVNYKGSPEPLFALLLFFSANFFDNFHIIYIVSSFIGLVFTYIGFSKMYGKTSLSLVIFWFSVTYYMIFFGLVRLSIAVGIMTYAFHLIAEKKTKKYFFLCTIATMFHYSAGFMFLVYFVLRRNSFKLRKRTHNDHGVQLEELSSNVNLKTKKLKMKRRILFIGIALLGVYWLFPYFFGGFSWFPRYIQYFKYDFNLKTINNLAGYYLLILLLMFTYKKVKVNIPESNQLLTFFWLMCSIALVTVKFPVIRLLYYFMPVGCYLYAFVPRLFNKYLRVYVYSIYLAYGLIWWLLRAL